MMLNNSLAEIFVSTCSRVDVSFANDSLGVLISIRLGEQSH
jgi:hypothetical protein